MRTEDSPLLGVWQHRCPAPPVPVVVRRSAANVPNHQQHRETQEVAPPCRWAASHLCRSARAADVVLIAGDGPRTEVPAGGGGAAGVRITLQVAVLGPIAIAHLWQVHVLSMLHMELQVVQGAAQLYRVAARVGGAEREAPLERPDDRALRGEACTARQAGRGQAGALLASWASRLPRRRTRDQTRAGVGPAAGRSEQQAATTCRHRRSRQS